MSVVISNANTRCEVGTANSDNCVLSLKEYWDIAQRCIGRFASPSLAYSMLKDEDAISFVVHELAIGSHRWSPERGKTFRSYLNQCAIWAIKNWVSLKKSSGKNEIKSLNHVISDDKQMYNIIPDHKAVEPCDELINRQNTHDLNDVLNSKLFNDRQRKVMKMHFFDCMKQSDIARELDVSREAIRQTIEKGLSKLRNHYEQICA